MQDFQQALVKIQNGDNLSNKTTSLSTSRCRVLLDIPVSILQMQPLSKADAKTLLIFLCSTLRDNGSLAEQLAEYCGNIPLALQVVGKTIKQGLATAEVMYSSRCFQVHAHTFPIDAYSRHVVLYVCFFVSDLYLQMPTGILMFILFMCDHTL